MNKKEIMNVKFAPQFPYLSRCFFILLLLLLLLLLKNLKKKRMASSYETTQAQHNWICQPSPDPNMYKQILVGGCIYQFKRVIFLKNCLKKGVIILIAFITLLFVLFLLFYFLLPCLLYHVSAKV